MDEVVKGGMQRIVNSFPTRKQQRESTEGWRSVPSSFSFLSLGRVRMDNMNAKPTDRFREYPMLTEKPHQPRHSVQ